MSRSDDKFQLNSCILEVQLGHVMLGRQRVNPTLSEPFGPGFTKEG